MANTTQYAWVVEGSSKALTICELLDQPGIRVEATHVYGSPSIKPAGGRFMGRVKVIGPKESVEMDEEEDALRKLVKEEIARKRRVRDAKASLDAAIDAERAAIDFRAQKETEFKEIEAAVRTKTEAKIKTNGRNWLGRKKNQASAAAGASPAAAPQSPVVMAREMTFDQAAAIRDAAHKEAERKVAEMEAKAATRLADAEKKATERRLSSAVKSVKKGGDTDRKA